MKANRINYFKISLLIIFAILSIILVGCKSNEHENNKEYEEIINNTKEEIKQDDTKIDYVSVVYLDNDGTILQNNQYKKDEVIEEYKEKIKSKKIKGITYTFNSWKKIYSDDNNIFYLAIYNYPNIKDYENETIIYESSGSSGSGSTPSNKAVIKYLNENGQSITKSFDDGLVITLDAGSGNTYPSPINNQTIKLYVPKSQVLDLTNDVVKPTKTNYLFSGYQYNEGNKTFSAQFVEAALVKYFDIDKDEESYEYFYDGSEIVLNAAILKYSDTSTNIKTLTLTKGNTYDLTQSSYYPDLINKYKFLGYKFNKSNKTFTCCFDFDIQIGDILTIDSKEYRVLNYDSAEKKVKLLSLYSICDSSGAKFSLAPGDNSYKDSNVYNVCKNYYNSYLKSKFPNIVPFNIPNQSFYAMDINYPLFVRNATFNETVYCSLLRIEDVKDYDDNLNAPGVHILNKLLGSGYSNLVWLLDGNQLSDSHSFVLNAAERTEYYFQTYPVEIPLDVCIMFYTKLTDNFPFTITYGFRS